MHPQGQAAGSALGQAAAQAQRLSPGDQHLMQQFQQAQQQMGSPVNYGNGMPAQPGQGQGVGVPQQAGQQLVDYQQHLQNPQVQQALGQIGHFLGTIGHPLASMFAMHQGQGQGQQQGLPVQGGYTAAATGPIGQSMTGGNPEGMGQEPLHVGSR